MRENKAKINISIVIPIYNEADNINLLYLEIREVFSYTNRTFEIIFVNDSSNDGSLLLLKDIAKRDKRVKIISFPRNFGQTAALSAGIDHAMGEIIIPMDGDLQNDPSDIPLLVEKIEEGYSVVSGWRKNRKDNILRVIPSIIANIIIKKFTGVRISDNGCSLKAYRREVIEGVQLYGEMHRFISIYAAWSGGKVTEIVVNHRPRKFGKSKYGYSRIFKVLLDLMVVKFLHKYISRPIHFFGKYGFWVVAIGFFVELVAVIWKIFYHRSFISTPLPQIGIMCVIVGFQFIFTGIIAELLMRTYYESQNLKSYRIKEMINIK